MKRIKTFLFILIILAAAGNSDADESKVKSKDYSALFPAPLNGWKASDVTVHEEQVELLFHALDRIKLSRTYSGIGHDGRLTIDIDTYDCTTSSLVSVAQSEDPQVRKDLELLTYKSYQGAIAYDDKKRLQRIVIEIASCKVFVIKVDAFDGDKSMAMDYLQASDLENIHAFMEKR